MELKKALKEYQENIPDPKEWSQDYPWFCSNAWKDTPTWDKDKPTLMDLDISPNESKWEEKLYRAKLNKEIRIEEQNLTSDSDCWTKNQLETDPESGFEPVRPRTGRI
ncbi:hypothetical protein Gotri_013402, partial [Gossypium trilobum]|nr:hypothetical protein [Gossypium trilobum]